MLAIERKALIRLNMSMIKRTTSTSISGQQSDTASSAYIVNRNIYGESGKYFNIGKYFGIFVEKA